MGVPHPILRRSLVDHSSAGTARSGTSCRANEITSSERPAVLGQNLDSAHDHCLVRLAGSDGSGCGPVPLVRHAALAAMRRRGVDSVVVLDDRPRLSGEPISDGGGENPNGTRAQSDLNRALRRGPPSALRRHADLSAGKCVAAGLLVRPCSLVCSFRRPRFSDGDGGSRVAAPQAQGTIRPLSERAFFMLGFSLFGLDALPFKMVVFATQFANLALVTSIGARLTGLRWAGFFAAVFWALNSSGIEPLGWSCVYDQVLCGFFLLLAFHFLLRYIETGERRYNLFQWAAFLVGFGALELNVVYPVSI